MTAAFWDFRVIHFEGWVWIFDFARPENLCSYWNKGYYLWPLYPLSDDENASDEEREEYWDRAFEAVPPGCYVSPETVGTCPTALIWTLNRDEVDIEDNQAADREAFDMAMEDAQGNHRL